jgi:hypothetical protein
MGAYSSWAMLALTHHCIIQFAASKAGCTSWFSDYAVLGDDVVIGNHGVAREYLSVMGTLGVSINKSKSLVSKNLSMEFAKRFYYKGKDVTPFPLVGLSTGWLGLGFVPEVINSVANLNEKVPTLYSIARYLGFGYKSATALASAIAETDKSPSCPATWFILSWSTVWSGYSLFLVYHVRFRAVCYT